MFLTRSGMSLAKNCILLLNSTYMDALNVGEIDFL